MSKVKIIYNLSEEGRKKSLLSGGDGKEKQYLYTEITSENLKYATVNANGEAYIECLSYRKPELSTGFGGRPYISYSTKLVYFDDIQTVEGILNFIKSNEVKYKESENELNNTLKSQLEEWKLSKEAEEERKRIELENAKAERERKSELKEKIENDKRDWINSFGSKFLKDAYNNGYNCQRKYVEERVSLELPGFEIDFDGEISIKSRSMPSEKALYKSLEIKDLGYDCDVSWAPYLSEDGEEVVCIYNYLGKYFLYKIID